MLKALHIKNVVLIEQLSLSLEQGLCALTGETGAGKSILLDSLGLALGQRSEAGLVRKGADKASVSAEFELMDRHPVYQILDAQDLERDDVLILRRVVNKDGRSRAFVNDQPISVSLLKEIGASLVEIHGQFETQGLLDVKTHGALLDSYAGLEKERLCLSALWGHWKAAREALEDAREQAQKNREEESYLRDSLEDLERLDPKAGEEEHLASLRERLKHKEDILQALSIAQNALSSEEGGEVILNQACRALERVADKGGNAVSGIIASLDSALAEIGEARVMIESTFADMEDGEHSLEEIDDRLHDLRAQARKHDCVVDDLPRIIEKLGNQLALIDDEGDILAQLEQNTIAARQDYITQAQLLRKTRQEAAFDLDRKIGEELPPLKLEKARFVTEITDKAEANWNEHGMDTVRFLVATNPGADPGPLNKIASGGEMSRFMLALKVVMAEQDDSGTFIFDEVDSGIGGATADAVGERLSRLANRHQILVVTHSPQVAARANHHFIVRKDGGEEVKTTIIPLKEKEKRREEIARMISGADITKEARAAADKLLETSL